MSDSLLPSEDELRFEGTKGRHLFLEISRKSDVGLKLMAFNLKRDSQLLNFALIIADNR